MQAHKVLFIGFGSIAQKHAKALRTIFPTIELHALRSSSQSTEIDGVQSFHSLAELNLLNYSFVIISNPSYLHAESILQIAEYTSAFFIEKPAFLTIKEGEAVVNSIGEKLNYVACNLRFLDSLNQLKKWIDLAEIHPNLVDFKAWSFLPDWRPTQDYRQSYSASKSEGGGVVFDLIHEPDYIYWLFGKPNFSSVNAAKLSSLEIDSSDTAHIKFDYSAFSVTGSLSYASRITKRSLTIVAEEGLIEVDLLQNSIFKNGIKVFQSSQRIADTYLLQMQHFIDCINRKQKPINEVKQALIVAQMMQFN